MCCRCINSCGNDRIGCVLMPVHSMIVDETLGFLEIIMIFALDKCNDVVTGSWCIIMSMYPSSFQCGGIIVIPLGLCVRSEWDAFVISRDCFSGVRHVLVKTMHFHVYHCDSVMGVGKWNCMSRKYKIRCIFNCYRQVGCGLFILCPFWSKFVGRGHFMSCLNCFVDIALSYWVIQGLIEEE